MPTSSEYHASANASASSVGESDPLRRMTKRGRASKYEPKASLKRSVKPFLGSTNHMTECNPNRRTFRSKVLPWLD